MSLQSEKKNPVYGYKDGLRLTAKWVLTWRFRERPAVKRASLYSPQHAVLIELLRDLRLEAGLSQTEAATALERPQTYISAVEVGQRGIPYLQVRELCALYGWPLPKFAVEFEKRLQAPPYRPPRRKRASAPSEISATRPKGTAATSRMSKPMKPKR